MALRGVKWLEMLFFDHFRSQNGQICRSKPCGWLKNGQPFFLKKTCILMTSSVMTSEGYEGSKMAKNSVKDGLKSIINVSSYFISFNWKGNFSSAAPALCLEALPWMYEKFLLNEWNEYEKFPFQLNEMKFKRNFEQFDFLCACGYLISLWGATF